MENICSKLQECISFISRYLPLVNSHMVEFFSKNLWEHHVPQNLKTEFILYYQNKGNVVDLFLENMFSDHSELGKFIQSCSMVSLEKNEIIINTDMFKNKFQIGKLPVIDCANIDKFMSEKKVHEVKMASEIIATLFTTTNATHIIDLGDGKGYLSSYLSLKYKFKVLGVDSSTLLTQGAAKRAHKLEKQWNSAFKKYNKNGKESFDNITQFEIDNIECSNNSTLQDESYKQVTRFITCDTDLKKLLFENFPQNNIYQFGLVGLHTCGNLSPICLKQFLCNKNHVPFLLNIGCCYHLLEEGEAQQNSFPLSSHLKNINFKLGRNARMLSLQAPNRIFASKKIPQSLMFRAVFEVFAEKKLGKYFEKEREVGRIGSKCSSFVEYSRKAFKKLGFDLEVSDDEICDFFEKYSSSCQLLEFYFMIRVALAPVIENIILLDRLLYLQENGIKQSFLIKLFDSYISPRCYGVVAIRDK